MHQEEKDAAKGQKGAWRSRDGEYARDVVERGCNGRKRGPVIAGTDVMLVLQSFCFQHQQSCLRGYKGCLGDILSLSVDQSPLQFSFPALYWARAALRPLVTSQRLDPDSVKGRRPFMLTPPGGRDKWSDDLDTVRDRYYPFPRCLLFSRNMYRKTLELMLSLND